MNGSSFPGGILGVFYFLSLSRALSHFPPWCLFSKEKSEGKAGIAEHVRSQGPVAGPGSRAVLLSPDLPAGVTFPLVPPPPGCARCSPVPHTVSPTRLLPLCIESSLVQQREEWGVGGRRMGSPRAR